MNSKENKKTKIGKWIGTGLGWAVGGPIGALIGFAIGYYIDQKPGLIPTSIGNEKQTTPGDFVASMLVLVAGVMKADGVVRRSELDYVKGYLIKSFGEESAREATQMLRDILKREIPIMEVGQQIAQNLDYASRLQLMHFLFGISNADGELHERELNLIQEIAHYLEISQPDYSSIRSMFKSGTETAYDTLGVTSDASEEKIKASYRQMANKYHPDKVAYLGEEFRSAAEQKFTKLNEAYEQIKRERGFY